MARKSKIIAGLKDAARFARGDRSRAIVIRLRSRTRWTCAPSGLDRAFPSGLLRRGTGFPFPR